MANTESKRQYENELLVLKDIKKLHNSKGEHQYSPWLIDLYHKGFPRLLTHGYLEDKLLNYLVITKFDIDLESLYSMNKKRFHLSTILTIGVLMLEILEKFHVLGYVHNDLKP